MDWPGVLNLSGACDREPVQSDRSAEGCQTNNGVLYLENCTLSPQTMDWSKYSEMLPNMVRDCGLFGHILSINETRFT